ncbi:MAG: hypothetical protein ABI203_11385 [Mucilaginibacter sp.]
MLVSYLENEQLEDDYHSFDASWNPDDNDAEMADFDDEDFDDENFEDSIEDMDDLHEIELKDDTGEPFPDDDDHLPDDDDE